MTTLAAPATSGITSTMTAALAAAQTTMNNVVGSGSLDNLSLAQLQQIIAAFETAYNVYAAGLKTPAGINLDTIVGPSTLDGYSSFAKEVAAVAIESDVQTALFYLGRIISNLMLAGG